MNVSERLQAFRGEMKRRRIAAYIVPSDDFHGSEYVGEHFKVREYLSGFTGSAGTLVVMPERAFLWTDGRYFLQAERQLSGSGIELMKSGQPDVPGLVDFLAKEVPAGAIIGFDGRVVTGAFVEELRRKTARKRIALYGKRDLAELIWEDRPPLPAEPVWELEASYAGASREEKLAKVREKMEEAGADAFLVTALDETAWLLNLRGNDVKYAPLFLSYLFITKKRAILCAQTTAFSAEICEKLKKAGISLLPYDSIEGLIASLPAGQCILVDERKASYRLLQAAAKGVERINQPSPIALLKAVKTPREIEHIRAAHRKDGVALTRFIYWLKTRVDKEEITEMSAAEKLEQLRAEQDGYLGASFAPVIACGGHGAVVHYEATPETDVRLPAKGLCLLDTGGHYSEGTTDVTRTIALGELSTEEKNIYTLVLKGHLRLAAVRFLEGVYGQSLDILARQPLWEEGFDYAHGTGHGVGYLLNVHEGPQNINWKIPKGVDCVPLQEGMVVSNEPGLYLPGKFGVRHENLELVRKGEKSEYGQFMYLEPLTLAPFDRDAMEVSLLTAQEVELINAYHKRVFETLSPYLQGEEFSWLKEATAELEYVVERPAEEQEEEVKAEEKHDGMLPLWRRISPSGELWTEKK